MAIDFLIFVMLLLSFVINCLALGAFWVTPGLRTTANRFTINLLIINLIGCIILAPTLFLSGTVNDSNPEASNLSLSIKASQDSLEIYSKPGNHQMTIRHNGKLVEQEGIIIRRNVSSEVVVANKSSISASDQPSEETIETIYKCNSTYCQELTIDESSDTIVITEIDEERHTVDIPTQNPPDVFKQLLPPRFSVRCWSIDLAAALGALAVLLVVGDTWCAVTDPLRYHSRISGMKAWIFIALTWVMGILFGALSALRELDFESDAVLSKQSRADMTFTESYFSLTSTNNVFSMIFACCYFVVIILLPFGFVCGMYWRIFSEARENGLRMRQNGSSPLLQSALNLHNQHGQHSAPQLQYTNSLCIHRNSVSSTSSHSGGLQMQIDQQQEAIKSSPAFPRRDSAAKVLLPTIADDGVSVDADADSTTGQLVPAAEQESYSAVADRNQNILLTLQAASGEIKRNYSNRQLPILGNSSQDLCDSERLQIIRQVHSSPNLQKYAQGRQDSLNNEICSRNLLGHQHLQFAILPVQRHSLHHSHLRRSYGHHSLHQQQSSHQHRSLQIPVIHGSPKAFSYMSSLRHRLSNASSLFKYREESRAARISILVVIMFLVSYLPYGFLVLLQSRIHAANFENSTQLAIFMILLGNLSSPFIFAYRNKRVRRGVKRLFGLDTRCRESTLQRQGSSSARGSVVLQRHSSTCIRNVSCPRQANMNGISLERNGNKVSTYSLNSCKQLTPQSTVGSPGTVTVNSNAPIHATLQLRANSSCSTIINLFESKNLQQEGQSQVNKVCHNSSVDKGRPQPTLHHQRHQSHSGITVEQLPSLLNVSKISPKPRLFKHLFQSSKNLGSCATAQSCAEGSCTEPADV